MKGERAKRVTKVFCVNTVDLIDTTKIKIMINN